MAAHAFRREVRVSGIWAVATLCGSIAAGCGNDEAAARLLADARDAALEARFEVARRYLDRALDEKPRDPSLREEILLEKELRLPLAEGGHQLRNHDVAGLTATLERLEEFVDRHPEQVKAARQVGELRRSLAALELALSTHLRLDLGLIARLWENETLGDDQDQERFAEFLASLSQGRRFEVESYRVTDDGYRAVLVDTTTGTRHTLEPPRR